MGKKTSHGKANAALLRTALLSLIDIGVRLSNGVAVNPDIRTRLASCLAEMSNLATALDVKVLDPLVLSFERHTGATKVQYQQTLGAQKISVFQADPSTVAAELQTGPDRVIQTFQQVIAGLLKSDIGIVASAQSLTPAVPPTTPTQAAGGPSDSSVSCQAPSGDESTSDNPPLAPVGAVATGAMSSGENGQQLEVPNVAPVGQDSEESTKSAAPVAVSPPESRGIVFAVGRDLASQLPVEYWPSNTAMTNMNIGVFGDPGTGKTQVCLALLYQLHHGSVSAQGHGLSGLVLDPKNDYGRPERRAFQEALGARVVEPLHIPIDVIGLRAGMTRVEERQRIQTFVDLVSTVMGKGVGQVQRELLFTVIDALVQRHHRSPTLVEVRDAYRNAKNNKADVVSSLLGDFVNNEVFVSDPSKFVPMSDLISKELLIVNLKSLQTRADLLKQVMAIFVNQYFDAMLQMPIPGFRRGTDGLELRQLKSVLLIDEAHLVMRLRFQQLEDILLQGREIGISVILSSQFPDHFMNADMNYAMSLRTWFMHRVPALSASDLRRLGIAKDVEATSARILGLGKYESFFSSGLGEPAFIRETPFHELVPDSN